MIHMVNHNLRLNILNNFSTSEGVWSIIFIFSTVDAWFHMISFGVH